MYATTIDFFLVFLIALTGGLLLLKGTQLFLGARLLKRDEPAMVAQAVERSLADRKEAVSAELERLEGGMTLLATVAAAAPFLGLMGTVMHIMVALSRLSGAYLDITLISGPIATALNSTLLGLASAVPAAIAYNLYSRRLQVLDNRARRAFEHEVDTGKVA